MNSKLSSLQTGLPKTIHDPKGDWISGIWKSPVDGPVHASFTGLSGDGQGDLSAHGGPDKAIYAYPEDHYDYWRAELGLPDLPYGGFGENFTLSQLSENAVCIGDVFRVGDEVVVQVSEPRGPCWKLARRLGIKDIVAQVIKSGYTGWYFRVLQEGQVSAGMQLTLLDHPYPEWTITRANQCMRTAGEPVDNLKRLVECPALAESWRKGLLHRLSEKS
jgi:MOSC domain-containing protein YiiM